MTLARYQFTVVDDAGNVQDGATVTVRAETIGNPLASLFSDRAGVVATGNPVTADSEGYAAFHVAGGAYMITATKGSFTRTWRYVAIGLMAETDGGSAGRALLNLATTDIVQFGGLDLPIGGEIRWDVTGSPETADVAITHSAGALAFTGAASGYSFDAKVTGLSFGITSVAPVMIAGPSSAVAASTMATEWLWGESAARTALTAEGAIWAGAVHNGVGIAKTFTSAHNQAVANTGPAAALFAYARNDACNADVVGVLADAHAVTANQTVFGANFIGRNDAVNGVKIVGCEIDVEFAAGTTAAAGSAGLYINVFNVAVPGPAVQFGSLSGGTFNNGMVIAGIASNGAGVSPGSGTTMGSLINTGAATFNDSAIVLSNTHRTRYNGTAAAHAYVYNDNANNLRIVGGSAGTVVRNNSDLNSNLTIADNGDVTGIGFIKSSSPTKGIGYGTGAGGTVTQATSKSTGVTLNTVCGDITMNNATLNAGNAVAFTLTNSAIAATDNVVCTHVSGGVNPGAYTITAQPSAGSASIAIRNNTAGNLSEAIVIRFSVIKGVTS
jgi:hypothetical protein